ncbi:hypothetical protein [Aromatoleum bremense]|uniref:Uncharacterized protein n=1 Tax=Aromatoleum bremense TaxID=76115 RepID=A0ABX1NUR8_9RHOO|nr:hypothetical protein [Aromatoleum bremense]NMG15756.1 hypothetical protein [Aromatoleum bremense]QTQ30046.1 Uncharacterized protein pbN1_00530 [Aromatoleum bremense]
MLIQVKLIRVDRFSGKTCEGVGELSIRKDEKGVYVYMTKGGETGFESFSLTPRQKVTLHDWCACMGRRGEYDTVTVPKDEMERAYRAAGIIE